MSAFCLKSGVFRLYFAPPSQRSHRWQLVQPAVLRSGHLQTLSSAISWLFPMHRSACILQTVRRMGLFVLAAVVHTSRDELGEKGNMLSKQLILKKKQQTFGPLNKFGTLKRKLPALKRHLTHAFSFWMLLPWLTLDLSKCPWSYHCRTHRNDWSLWSSWSFQSWVCSFTDLGCTWCLLGRGKSSDWGHT